MCPICGKPYPLPGALMAACPDCQGCGQKVNFYVVYDSDGNEHTHQQADPCSGCGGSGEVN